MYVKRAVVETSKQSSNLSLVPAQPAAGRASCHANVSLASERALGPSAEMPRRNALVEILSAVFGKARLLKHERSVRRSALFDESYYLARNPEVVRMGIESVRHYFVTGAMEGLDPNPLFKTLYYLSCNPDVQRAGVNPLAHYLIRGAREGRNPHPLFDGRYYLSQVSMAEQINPLVHYVTQGRLRGLRPHPLFDPNYYLSQDREAAGTNADPLARYVTQGWLKGLDPHPLFNVHYYLSQVREAADANPDPLVHYVTQGWLKGFSPHPLFDLGYYLSQNPELANAGIDPLVHYLTQGWLSGRSPHPLFDASYYLSQNPDVSRTGGNPLVHYLAYGWRERRQPHPLFDVSYYLSQSRDGQRLSGDPLTHYVLHGHGEPRNPHPLFDSKHYLSMNPDVARDRMNPLLHFVLYGAREGREPHPHFDTDFYVSENADVAAAQLNPLIHYVTVGFREGRDPNPAFDTSRYIEENPEIALRGINPLLHCLENVAPFDLRGPLRNEFELSRRAQLDSEYDSYPVVSIVIPCLNHARFLEDAILSGLLACSYPLEIIVVVDRSLDSRSIRLINELAARYKFILIRRHPSSLNMARSTGIKVARGKFLQLLDPDDFLASNKIDIQIEDFRSHPEIDVCLSEYEFCDERGLQRRLCSYADEEVRISDGDGPFDWAVPGRRSIPIHCALFRKTFLEKLSVLPSGDGREDWSFWSWVSAQSPKIRCNAAVLATERVHHQTVSKKERTLEWATAEFE